ncbi:MAG: mechanosensitive ion channel domain-containing protein [Myxococcota bacterium]
MSRNPFAFLALVCLSSWAHAQEAEPEQGTAPPAEAAGSQETAPAQEVESSEPQAPDGDDVEAGQETAAGAGEARAERSSAREANELGDADPNPAPDPNADALDDDPSAGTASSTTDEAEAGAFIDIGADSVELQLVAEAQRRQAEAAERAQRNADDEQRRQEQLRELEAMFERARERLRSEPQQSAAEPQEVVVRTEITQDDSEFFAELEGLAEGLRGGSTSVPGLLFLAVLAALLAVGIGRLRARFRRRGIIPAALALAHLAARILVVLALGAVVVRFLPPRAALVLLFALAGLAFALGWTVRDVLPDLLAGVVLAFERRLAPGMWLSTKTFAGEIVDLGLRSTTLRDAQGHEVSVPNRMLLQAPVSTDRERERAHDVTLRIGHKSYGRDAELTAERTRQAIFDAVLSSPWVAPDQEPVVFRDPKNPELWRVRARLLEARFGVRFEGDLLERAEAILRH